MALYHLAQRNDESRRGFIWPFTNEQQASESEDTERNKQREVKATIVKFKRKTKARVFRFLDTRKGRWSSNYHMLL